jgi:hypothetical protein
VFLALIYLWDAEDAGDAISAFLKKSLAKNFLAGL